jgi:hypothetical protein
MLFASSALAANFTVTVDSSTGTFMWNVNGTDNPTLTLTRGATYVFAVTSPGHPFDIKTSPVTGTADQFTEGVTGEETTSGNLTFTVPADAPNPLYYQCEVHGTMSGVLQIVPAVSPTPAPALAWPAALALALALGGAALFFLRKRAAG